MYYVFTAVINAGLLFRGRAMSVIGILRLPVSVQMVVI